MSNDSYKDGKLAAAGFKGNDHNYRMQTEDLYRRGVQPQSPQSLDREQLEQLLAILRALSARR